MNRVERFLGRYMGVFGGDQFPIQRQEIRDLAHRLRMKRGGHIEKQVGLMKEKNLRS